MLQQQPTQAPSAIPTFSPTANGVSSDGFKFPNKTKKPTVSPTSWPTQPRELQAKVELVGLSKANFREPVFLASITSVLGLDKGQAKVTSCMAAGADAVHQAEHKMRAHAGGTCEFCDGDTWGVCKNMFNNQCVDKNIADGTCPSHTFECVLTTGPSTALKTAVKPMVVKHGSDVHDVVVRFSLYIASQKQATSVIKQLKVGYFPALLASSLLESGMGVRTVRLMKGAHEIKQAKQKHGDEASGWDDDDYSDYKGLLGANESKKMVALLSAQRRIPIAAKTATKKKPKPGSLTLPLVGLSAACILLVSAVFFCSGGHLMSSEDAPVETGEKKSLVAPKPIT
jgi:hypothetical protein